MPDSQKRFQVLADQFEVLENNVSECQNQEQRRELLREMLVVIEELDQLVSKDLARLDSTPDSTAPTNPPSLRKAAHQ
jgi:hypothetical protein